ncbi:putative aminohydrolase SsnA [Veillonella caviae]|uniref:putative aminohydrolase SsnA n=1 Tax=Veillonella caviae TaxID=248316 RepID=UPI0023542F96|nr:putative aminohydrolase SsnA [Veillonella caviae]
MILLGRGTVITRDVNRPIIYDGGVLIDGSIIVAVEDFKTLQQKYPNVEIIDAHNGLIMPGFINGHHHIYSALARGLSMPGPAPTNFGEILENLWFKLDNHLLADDVKASALLTYMGCIENGVTTIFDHHASYGDIDGSLSIIADVAKRFGVRSCLCYEISDRNGVEAMKQAVHENLRFADEAEKDAEHLAAMMGLHASFTLSPSTLDYVKSKNTKQLGYHIHIAEGPEDVQDSLEQYGVSPVRRLYECNILGSKTIAGHCVHVNDEDVQLLKDSHTNVVHNPESNMGNAVGTTDILKLLGAGITVGLGTDGYTNDMLESYKVANCLVKHENHKPYVGWNEVPYMLFENNRTLANQFFDVTVGVLRPSAAADVVVLDYIAPTPLDEKNINGHLLFGATGMHVITTISDGIPRMIDRQLQGLDKAEIMEYIRKTSETLWKRII